ncbi:MAG: response regulator, partial [Oligoflexales bacterium]|nr:response regulator [Oligoflexales bacterium]
DSHKNTIAMHYPETEDYSEISSTTSLLLLNRTKLTVRITSPREPFDIYFWILLTTCSALSICLTVTMWLLFRDNYKRKLMQVKLEKAKEAAEKANKMKTQLIANISHEMRTPLGAIKGYADLLSGHNPIASEQVSCIEGIRRNGAHLLDLIDDFLDLSKIEAGLLEIDRMKICVTDLVSECIDLFRNEIMAKNLDLKIEYIGDIPEQIETDPKRLRQILVNVLGNAVKFTLNGSIRMDIKVTSYPPNKHEKMIEFTVTDTGIGIEKEYHDLIFQPFQQASPYVQKHFGGTGLGLAISKRISGMLGGNIVLLDSQFGRGSSFRFFVSCGDLKDGKKIIGPAYSPERKVCRPDAAEMDVSGITILIVEDCKDNRIIYKHYLESSGANVILAESGRAGIERAMNHHCDAVIMDLKMPELDGYETTMQLRQMGFKKPIIALTAHAMRGERERCLALGCDDYLSKPIDLNLLIKTILFHHQNKKEYEKAFFSQANESPRPSPKISMDRNSPIVSTLMSDPRAAPLIPEFVEGLFVRLRNIESSLVENDFTRLSRLSHQMKGTLFNYGFPTIGRVAKSIEDESTEIVHMKEVLNKKTAELSSQIMRAKAGLDQSHVPKEGPGKPSADWPGVESAE